METSLPEGFQTLEPFVARFAVEGTANRAALRAAAPADERAAFHAAAKDLIAPALDFLDTRPLNALDPAERRLLALCLSFAHVALGVELQGPDEDRHAEMRAYMRITRSPADSLA